MKITVVDYEQFLQDIRQLIREEIKAPGSDMIGIPEACKITGYQQSTLYSKIASQSIPYLKVGRKIRFSKKELEKWITDQN